MPLPTDYHVSIRDAINTVLAAAMVTDYAALSANVVSVEDPENDIKALVNLPAVVCACVGPEQERPEYGTNQRTGKAFPVIVMLMTSGVSGGQKAPNVPTMTLFRRLVETTFNKKRLAGVSEVSVCEVSDSGPIFDKDSPAFQKLQTAMVVTAVGRFPRA